MSDSENMLDRVNKPAEEAMRLHPFYRGKVEVALKSPVRDVDDFAIWYTPGVAEPCKAIAENKDEVYRYTNKGNFVAIVSDGTRVLGLGDIGPEAAMPVMEGKALLFKYLGGVDAFPICVDTKDPDELISFVKMLQPCFGGINLEDIASPKCFDILDRLRKECRIPVWHDDQQGTALVTLAGLLNALKIVGKKMAGIRLVMIGAGAANLCTARLLIAAGADPAKVIMIDSKGALHRGRADLEKGHPLKWEMCLKTNAAGLAGGAEQALRGADVLIALSRPGPGRVKKEWIASMAEKAIVFACANPTPEIWPWEAREAGAAIVSTGRSDFPNQVNNSLGFPAIFRGVLDVQASTITDSMCIAAARELAACAPGGGRDPGKILPTMDMPGIYPRVAAAAAAQAIEEGAARVNLGREEILKKAETVIGRAQALTRMMMDERFIPTPP